LGYQLIQRGGGVQFSIWTYLPHVAIVARPVLAAALLIGAQLLLGYWFYSYLTWVYPLLIIAIIQARSWQDTQTPPRVRP
jgi:hypothetical protein